MRYNKIITAFITFAAISFLSSCTDDGYKPGPKDSDNCAEVYFPSGQDGSVVLKESDKTEIRISAKRANTEGNIVVPIEVSSSEKNVFYATALTFKDGEEASSFILSFPDAQIQHKYDCHIAITDPDYARQYGLNPISLDFNIIREDNKDYAVGTFTSSKAFSSTWQVVIDYSPVLDEYRFKSVYTDGWNIPFKWKEGEENVEIIDNPANTGMLDSGGMDYIYVTFESATYNKYLKRFEFQTVYKAAGQTLAESTDRIAITQKL